MKQRIKDIATFLVLLAIMGTLAYCALSASLGGLAH